ncbi:MAG: hypothetical protein ILA11_11060 [Butyrivibrio sp.]|nr:hypothetical protein [Butyrivibrio sp.]
MKDSRFYSLIEAAELLETSSSTVCMLVNKGELDMLHLDTRSNPVFAERHLLDYMIKNEK